MSSTRTLLFHPIRRTRIAPSCQLRPVVTSFIPCKPFTKSFTASTSKNTNKTGSNGSSQLTLSSTPHLTGQPANAPKIRNTKFPTVILYSHPQPKFIRSRYSIGIITIAVWVLVLQLYRSENDDSIHNVTDEERRKQTMYRERMCYLNIGIGVVILGLVHRLGKKTLSHIWLTGHNQVTFKSCALRAKIHTFPISDVYTTSKIYTKLGRFGTDAPEPQVTDRWSKLKSRFKNHVVFETPVGNFRIDRLGKFKDAQMFDDMMFCENRKVEELNRSDLRSR